MRHTGVQPRAMQANMLHRVLSLPPQAIYIRAAAIPQNRVCGSDKPKFELGKGAKTVMCVETLKL